jgi:hypothetical protein
VAIFHGGILWRLGRLDQIEDASAPALRLASDQGMDSAFKTAQVRGNLVEALVELGATEAAAGWVEPVTKGTASLSTTWDYASRARIEMLRGNLDEAQRRYEEIDQLPASTLAFQADTATEQAELELWRCEAGAAFDRVESLLSRLAAAGNPIATPSCSFSGFAGAPILPNRLAAAATPRPSERPCLRLPGCPSCARSSHRTRSRPARFDCPRPPTRVHGRQNLAACTARPTRQCGVWPQPSGTA